MAFPLTEEQKRIVDDRGGELLVSAAAGSGKTRVLVERLMDRVTREGLDLDQFLVITYTKAAAGELRARIAQELSARLAEAPNDRHLRRQTALVYQAQISTIHAFCAALLRESGHLLDLDPDFRLCDEGEGHVMMAQVLEDVLEEQYQGIDPEGDFALLVDTLSAGRDDSRLAQIVLDVFGRIQSHPEPLRWLEEQKAAWELEGIADVGQTPWGALLLEDAARLGRDCVRRLEQAVGLCGEDELLEQNYAPSLQTTLEQVEALCAAADRHSWDQVYACLPIPFPAVGRKRKRTRELSPMEEARAQRAVERVKALRDGAKEQLTRLGERFDGDSGQLLADLAEARPAVRGLMDLVARFQEAYQREKARRGVLDFSDLEHFAVRLLLDPETGRPTPPGGQLVGPLCRGDGGRVSGHQPGAERHFHRRLRRGAYAFSGGGCEAVHLPLPTGRPHHLSGQIPPLPGRGGGRSRGAPPPRALPELPLPPPGAGGLQRPVPGGDVPGFR